MTPQVTSTGTKATRVIGALALVGLIAFNLVYIWLMMHKMRVMMMEDALDDHGLELALEERRAEAELQEVVP